MQFVLMTEPQQGMSYVDQLASAKRADANGFDAWFRSDHYASFPGAPGQPTTDAWTVLAGLARETERIGLGVLVSPVTFRHPGALAKVGTTVDWMSGGRAAGGGVAGGAGGGAGGGGGGGGGGEGRRGPPPGLLFSPPPAGGGPPALLE